MIRGTRLRGGGARLRSWTNAYGQIECISLGHRPVSEAILLVGCASPEPGQERTGLDQIRRSAREVIINFHLEGIGPFRSSPGGSTKPRRCRQADAPKAGTEPFEQAAPASCEDHAGGTEGAEQFVIHAGRPRDMRSETARTHWGQHIRTTNIDRRTCVKHDRTGTVDQQQGHAIGVLLRVGNNEKVGITRTAPNRQQRTSASTHREGPAATEDPTWFFQSHCRGVRLASRTINIRRRAVADR